MEMNPEQVTQLLSSLAKIADGLSMKQQYTITGAADWPLAVALAVLCGGLIGWMWSDLKATIKEDRGKQDAELRKHIENDERDHEKIWKAFGDCQSDCCPRSEKR